MYNPFHLWRSVYPSGIVTNSAVLPYFFQALSTGYHIEVTKLNLSNVIDIVGWDLIYVL